jgi:hypothetical protein
MKTSAVEGDGDGDGDGDADMTPAEAALAEAAFRSSHGYYVDDVSQQGDATGGLEVEGAVVETDAANLVEQQKAAAALSSTHEPVPEEPLTVQEQRAADVAADRQHEEEITVPLSQFAGTSGLGAEPLFVADNTYEATAGEEGGDGAVSETTDPTALAAAAELAAEEEALESSFKGYTDDDDEGWDSKDGLTAEEEADRRGRQRTRGRRRSLDEAKGSKRRGRGDRRRLDTGRKAGESPEAAIRRRLAADDGSDGAVVSKAGVWMVTCSFSDSANRGCYNSHGGVDDMGLGNTLAACHAGCVELEKRVTAHQPW